jgi:hypothetical protein
MAVGDLRPRALARELAGRGSQALAGAGVARQQAQPRSDRLGVGRDRIRRGGADAGRERHRQQRRRAGAQGQGQRSARGEGPRVGDQRHVGGGEPVGHRGAGDEAGEVGDVAPVLLQALRVRIAGRGQARVLPAGHNEADLVAGQPRARQRRLQAFVGRQEAEAEHEQPALVLQP